MGFGRVTAALFLLFSVAATDIRALETTETELKHLSLSISDVGEMIRGGYVYVDKTAFVVKMLQSPNRFCFLIRPRHFGKTTFLSTFKEIFENGNKTLFKGTAIYDSDYRWLKYPVISISMTDGSIKFNSPEELTTTLIEAVKKVAISYEITSLEGLSLKETIQNLINMLHQKFSKQVMVLIDDYDVPYTEMYEQPEVAKKNADVLRAFFAAIHSMVRNLRFCMMVGVVRITAYNLNAWTDLTLHDRYSTVAGFTQEELERDFVGHIDNVVRTRSNTTKEQVLNELKNWYEGYRFSASKTLVYNPWSIVSYFISKKRDPSAWPIWTSNEFLGMGRRIARQPNSAIDYLHRRKMYPRKYLDLIHVDRAWDEGLSELEMLLVTTGCLTIKKYDPKRDSLKLGYANRETHEGFYQLLLRGFGRRKRDELRQIVSGLKRDLVKLDLTAFVEKANLYTATFLANATDPDDQLSDNLHSHKITNGTLRVIFRTALMSAEMEIDDETSMADKLETIKLSVEGKRYLFDFRVSTDPLGACIENCNRLYSNQSVVCTSVRFDVRTVKVVDCNAIEFSEEGVELRREHLHAPERYTNTEE